RRRAGDPTGLVGARPVREGGGTQPFLRVRGHDPRPPGDRSPDGRRPARCGPRGGAAAHAAAGTADQQSGAHPGHRPIPARRPAGRRSHRRADRELLRRGAAPGRPDGTRRRDQPMMMTATGDAVLTPARAALEQACRKVGLDASGAMLLRDFASTVYLLPAEDVVVRLAEAGVPGRLERLTTSVRVTRWLVAHDFP